MRILAQGASMGFWSRLFGGGRAPDSTGLGLNLHDAAPPPTPAAGSAPHDGGTPPEYRNTDAHHAVLAYIRRIGAGGAADPAYERLSLTGDLEMDTLNLCELLLVLGREKGIDAEAVHGAMRRGIKIPGAEDYADDHGGKSSLANLLLRAAALAAPGPEGRALFTEMERRALLVTGAAGPGNEVRAFSPHITVGFLLKYVRAIGL
jgi:hypothetical protein